MSYGVEIRDALPEDASAACEVIRRSISELCGADHLNDALVLGRWLANKTPEIVASWISRPGNSVLVAVENGTILAVGSVTDAGQINLNYVSPDARFRGRVAPCWLRSKLERGIEGAGNAPFSAPRRLVAFTEPQGILRLVQHNTS